MKFIKQKSTGQIIHRESPYTDKTLDNAVFTHNINKADLEVVEENWTEDEWTVAMNNQLPYGERRKSEYPDIGDQLDMIYHAGFGGDEFQEAIKRVKEKFPKGAN